MYMIYWSTLEADGTLAAHSQEYAADQLTAVLKDMEGLRQAGHRFVGMVAENPNSVGKPGVDVTGPEYKDQWDKSHRALGPQPGVTYVHRDDRNK